MDKQQIQYIFDRYISIFLYGSRNISALMSDQLMEELSLEQFSLVRILYQNRSMRASELAEQLLVHKSEIGRASCRERAESAGGAVALKRVGEQENVRGARAA